ncbi:MAG TPA: hypothetical protein VM573_00525 [Actinomycetota bacterium]|jgi:hypothetical protein|nr:hypothetical protein [Actinomycetota bacterium]
MQAQETIQIRSAFRHPASPAQLEYDLYPSAIRSILDTWRTSRLQHDDLGRVQAVGRESGAKI